VMLAERLDALDIVILGALGRPAVLECPEVGYRCLERHAGFPVPVANGHLHAGMILVGDQAAGIELESQISATMVSGLSSSLPRRDVQTTTGCIGRMLSFWAL